MQDSERWQPSKFVRTAAGWAGSSDPLELGIGSRLIGNILADVGGAFSISAAERCHFTDVPRFGYREYLH